MTITQKAIKRFFYTIDPWQKPVSVRKGGSKKALLCYILSPFRNSKEFLHCNVIESIQMADVLWEMGFCVDAVDYRFRGKIDYNRYDLVIGFGTPFRNSFESSNQRLKRICYLTGASPNYSNVAEAKRISAQYKRTGVLTSPRREVYWPWVHGAVNSEALIVTGNEWTASTYSEINDHIFSVPVPYICREASLAPKTETRRGFVWFSGQGALYKGLDLTIEALESGNGNLTLDICGNIKREHDFISIYRNDLFNNERIKFYGLIPPNSNLMSEVVNRNAFVILPSCSEGGASSVITCMAKGLIPVVTKECAINLNGFGITIEEPTPEGVRSAMEQAYHLSDEEIQRQRMAVYDYVTEYHSADSFKEKFYSAIQKILIG